MQTYSPHAVPATPLDWAAWRHDDAPDYGEPGSAGALPPDMETTGDHLAYCCPGCGVYGLLRAGDHQPAPSPVWQITAGSRDDVTTLSLTPSILTACCGWHGYLTGGVFRPC